MSSSKMEPLRPTDHDGSTAAASGQISASQRRKDLFGDCALIEIIHLHDCLRGALRMLEEDVKALSHSVLHGEGSAVSHRDNVSELERRVAGRFKVIWSVFRAHSSAEDEFIWPALQSKTGRSGSPVLVQAASGQQGIRNEQAQPAAHHEPSVIEQEEYEEDHADEERMFRSMDVLLSKLRNTLIKEREERISEAMKVPSPAHAHAHDSVHDMAKDIQDLTKSLSQHLMAHLEKEETQCMPLVVKHLSKSEIHDLVGQIMGKRSSDTIAQIMTMAVQNLNETDREEMVRYMKQAMVGTFFERWLTMSGWMAGPDGAASGHKAAPKTAAAESDSTIKRSHANSLEGKPDAKKRKCLDQKSSEETCPLGNSIERCAKCEFAGVCTVAAAQRSSPSHDITSQTELEKFIRAIASNPELTNAQKNATIQGVRDSVWKSNLRHKNATIGYNPSSDASTPLVALGGSTDVASMNVHRMPAATATRSRRMTPASSYYEKDRQGNIVRIWSSDADTSKFPPDDKNLSLFSASELAPTYHDGANGAVLGCPHYARACKLRHPSSGRLYTCRLCCEQEREMPMKDQDAPLDRYEVTEVLCMRCGALQPAGNCCVNPKCESRGKPFAKYICNICNLYDDGPHKSIYHCPFCNVCRSGLGLGIDYRHCMRCNACVSLADDEHHCIPQRLQGSCPICHESMFESTEPLRGLKCGHCMHLSCFNMYMRGHSYTCPLCKKSVEDMREYFSLLDAAVRMQPMPTAYLSTMSNIHCQDCGRNGQVQYHFVGCKCPHCGSYNTRELGRVQGTNGTNSQHP